MFRSIRQWFAEMFGAYAREFRIIFHDEGIMLFFIFLPLAYPIIYSLIYNPELVREVPMVVVDNDRTPQSREFVRKMDATESTRIIGYAAEMGEARRAMNEHECYAILELPHGFGRKVTDGEGSQAVLYAEMSLLLRYRGFLLSATEVAMDMGADLQKQTIKEIAPLAETIAVGDPLNIEARFLGNIESGFDSFIMPGVIILILHQCIILVVGMAGGARHEYPSLLDYNPLKHRVPVMADMLGQMLAFLTIFLLPAAWIMHYVPLIFNFPMAGNPFMELVFILPMMIGCICLGYALQGIVWQREGIFITWVATSVAFLFLSGLTWPRSALPPVWKAISDIIPGTWGLNGFILMNTNGSTLAQVSEYYINLWWVALGWFVLAYIVQRWVVRPGFERRYVIECRQEAERKADPTSLNDIVDS